MSVVKFLAVPAVGLIVALLTIPALFATGDARLDTCVAWTGPVEVVLATIRQMESGGDYTARAAGSTASGAYQFLDSTWAGFGGYPSAASAPAEVQDAKAAESVQAVLDDNSGNVGAVPAVWYVGHLPAPDSPEWDEVPAPGAGNRLTVREYQTRWLTEFHNRVSRASGESGTSLVGEGVGVERCLPGVGIAPLDDGWAYPAPIDMFALAPVNAPHHDYPAWDWGVPTGTPIYAVRGGTITTVQYWPYNWWDRGCTTRSADCSTCGIGVSITDESGVRWVYCHGSDVHARVGDVVTAGTQILTSGNTGRSSGPHLHLQIRTVDGRLRCPQPLLESLRDTATGVAPEALPTGGCST